MRTLALCISLLAAICMQAQSISTDFDKKVITTDSLNMPRHTNAMTLVTMLPELLQRPGDFILSNYDVQINDMSVGYAADVVLSQLQIANVEKIEITESPVASYLHNGQGGSINFVLRTYSEEIAPLWGSAGLTVSSYADVAPQFNIGYRKGKFMVQGLLVGELTDRSTTTHTEQFTDKGLTNQSVENTKNRFATETARAYLQFDFTERDRLKFNISESFTYNDKLSTTDYNDAAAITQDKRATNLHLHLNYKHSTARNSLTVQAEYIYNPTRSLYDQPTDHYYRTKANSNNLMGKLEFKQLLWSAPSASGRANTGELTVGSNFNAVLANETVAFAQRANYAHPETRNTPQNDTYYVMPYLTLTFQFGKLRLKAMGEFQRFKYLVDINQSPYTAVSNDFTGKLMAEWHFSQAHNLRLILDRKLQRPTSNQLYPFLTYQPMSMSYVQGNPGLKPQAANEAMVEYLGHLRFADLHRLTLNAAVSYNYVGNVISSYYPNGNSGASEGLGATLHSLSYCNNGDTHIANANLMALYTYKAFSLSLVGNLYHNTANQGGTRSHYTYYNISLHPYFNLKDGWHGGARLVYYSRVNQPGGWLAGQATASMTVGKAWKHFSVFLSEELSFLQNLRDVTQSGSQRTEKSSALIGNVVGAGVRYSF